MIALAPLEDYLNQFHPEVYSEIKERLSSQPCNDELAELVHSKATSYTNERWQIQLITIAAILALCSPETLYVGCRVRLGVGKSLSVALGVSQQRVSQKFLSASHYYKNISWCRDAVDSIVKEVRGGEVNG